MLFLKGLKCLKIATLAPNRLLSDLAATQPDISALDLSENATQDFQNDHNKLKIPSQMGWNFRKFKLCNNSASNILLNPSNGDFTCQGCNLSGKWEELKSMIGQNKTQIKCKKNLTETVALSNNNKHKDAWSKSLNVKSLDPVDFLVLTTNSDLDFASQVFEKYNIRVFNSEFLFPVYDQNQAIIDVIKLNLNASEMKEAIEKYNVYGLQSVFKDQKNDHHDLFITDSIFNALALNQTTLRPVIAVTNYQFDDKVLALMEKYNEIIIWCSDRQLSYNLALKLNIRRCKLISHLKSPSECFRLRKNIQNILEEESFPLNSSNIIQFKDISDVVYAEIAYGKKKETVQWQRFDKLNDILKGHRSGELTVFTGPTGSGKTTFLSEYSIDLAIQGVKTLWGSFEIQNHRLAKMMMTQYAGLNLGKHLQLYNDIAQEFNKLPLFFMSFHGEESLENVIKTMSHAVILHNIKHVIIDNLQFMIGNTVGSDKFSLQDRIIHAFRRFATNFNCHVTIVIHPRKEDDNELLKISSIFGSAKVSQEADNVIILQDRKTETEDKVISTKFIEIVKNRFDGELGHMLLRFDKERLSFSTKKMEFKNDKMVENRITYMK